MKARIAAMPRWKRDVGLKTVSYPASWNSANYYFAQRIGLFDRNASATSVFLTRLELPGSHSLIGTSLSPGHTLFVCSRFVKSVALKVGPHLSSALRRLFVIGGAS